MLFSLSSFSFIVELPFKKHQSAVVVVGGVYIIISLRFHSAK